MRDNVVIIDMVSNNTQGLCCILTKVLRGPKCVDNIPLSPLHLHIFFIFNLYACPFSSWPCSLFCDNIQFLFFGCGFNSITCLATEGHGFLGVILDFLANLHILLLLSLSFV